MADTSTRSIFITGAGSGIGAATARRFAEKGWRVGMADRDGGAVRALSDALGLGAQPYMVDVLDRNQLSAALSDFVGPEGALDALFNSAGLLDMRRFEDTPPERMEAVIDVNIKGVINAIAQALTYLKATDDARIVTMSSNAARHGIPDMAVYSASKFAVRGLTEALNIEFEPLGIWVCDIMVGFVDTPMLSGAEHSAKSVEIAGIHVTSDMVADTVWRAMTAREVHLFVRDEDRDKSERLRATPPEDRRRVIGPATGYAPAPVPGHGS